MSLYREYYPSDSQWQHMPRSSAFAIQSPLPTFFEYPDHSSWPTDSIHQPYRGNVADTAPYNDYAESSHRANLSTSPHVSHPTFPAIADLPRSPSYSSGYDGNNQWGGEELYVFDGSSSSRQASAAPELSVKLEPEDTAGCFIMELSPPHASPFGGSLAPPTEVPLRATQASKKMRGMMTVFRLNPFAMHSGEGRGLVPAIREEARPLEEEPLIFEFQLDLDEAHLDGPEPHEQQLHSFSPGFELHDFHDEVDHSDWGDGHSESSAPFAWEIEYPTNKEDHHFQPDSPPSTLQHFRHTSRLHSCTYLIIPWLLTRR